MTTEMFVALGPEDETLLQPWQVEALCAQTDPEAFFPEKGGRPAAKGLRPL